MGWIVHKFGGTSVADASCIRGVADIVSAPGDDNLAVVVSAMRGTTDQLLELIDRAAAGERVEPELERIRARYAAEAGALLPAAVVEPLLEQLDADLTDIRSVLQALKLVRSASHRSRDLVSGYGEIWSARLLTAVLEARGARGEIRFVNARDVLVTEAGEMGPIVVWELTRERCNAALEPGFEGVAVITGYIASSLDGLPVTLGRNGSDYSASIFAALLGASEVDIWTDVDGVMSGDPRRVPEATVIDELSYNEAMELAYFGAEVIHPQTMAPAVAHGIPIRIRNTFNPGFPGTKISSVSKPRDRVVKGISAVDGVALVNLEGAGMIGVPGTADRLFGALRDAVRHAHLAGQLRALDLLRRARGRGELRAPRRRARVRARARAGAGAACRGHTRLRDSGRRRRRHGRAARQRRAFLQDARQRRHQRARDRAGSVGAQHLGRHREPRHDARAAGRALELLSFGQDGLDRRDRPGLGGRRAARPARGIGGAAARTVQPRPARARHRGLEGDDSRAVADRSRGLAHGVRERAAGGHGPPRGPRADGLSAALRAGRLHGEPAGRGRVSALARARHTRHHAEQARAQRHAGRVQPSQALHAQHEHALPVRGDGRRRAARDLDAQGPRRDG